MRRRSLWWVGASGLALAACATGPKLSVAPNAPEKIDHGAIANEQGVQIRVDANAWDGFPRDLHTVAPLRVTIINNSSHPLRVRYEDFKLVPESGGQSIAALPPLRLQGREFARGPSFVAPGPGPGYGGSGLSPISPMFDYYSFQVAPGYGIYYPGIDVWGGPFAFDPFFYDTYSTYWPVNLPSKDMLDRALPEGVIQPGGHVTGFIYFQNLPKGTNPMDLEANLVDAKTQQAFGRLDIPFIAKR